MGAKPFPLLAFSCKFSVKEGNPAAGFMNYAVITCSHLFLNMDCVKNLCILSRERLLLFFFLSKKVLFKYRVAHEMLLNL